MTAQPGRGTPAREEFRTPDEVIVLVDADQQPDGMGRVQFFAHWLTDQQWKPGGVAGQVFRTRLDEWVETFRRQRPVRVVEIGGGL